MAAGRSTPLGTACLRALLKSMSLFWIILKHIDPSSFTNNEDIIQYRYNRGLVDLYSPMAS